MRVFRVAGNERGSVLLISLVLVAIITLLGLALFDLAQIETELTLASQTDARVFEIAQAGLERAMDRLLRTMTAEGATAGTRASWANGSTVGGTTTALCTGGSVPGSNCDTTQYQPVNSAYLTNMNFPSGGSYTVEFMLITASDAVNGQPFNVPGGCLLPPGAPTTDPCENVILIRSTGTLSDAPAGYSRSRTLQALVKASGSSIFGGGITAGSAGTGSIRGNARIYGSIHVLGPSSAALSFGGSSGQFNNWFDLSTSSAGLAALARLRPLPLVCPTGLSCPTDANRVYSLGAKLLVASPVDQAVDAGGSATLGTTSNTGTYHTPARAGLGPLNEVRVGDGCAMPCDDATGSFTSGTTGRVHVVDDNITRPYPGVAPSFPLMTDPTTIGATSYLHYACVTGSSCFGASSSQEFFVSRARNVMAGCCPEIAGSLGSVVGLTDATPAFSNSFTYTDRNNVVQTAEVCWMRTTGTNLPPNALTLEFGSPTCATPSTPANPILIYMPSATPTTTGFKIDRNGGPTVYDFRGAAVIVTNGLAKIEEALQSCGASGPCAGQTFPENHMLGLLTTGQMEIGLDNSGIDVVMGLFYTSGIFYSKKQTNILGTASAMKFCFGGAGSGEGCPAGTGAQVPSFFQVPQDPNTLPEELFLGGGVTWSIATVPNYWMECRRGPADATLPTTPTGVCSYAR